MTSDRLLDVHHPCQPAISPDGTRVAFTVEAAFSLPQQGKAARVWVAAADGSGAEQVTDGPGGDRSPAWSPDGRTLAFASDRESPKVAGIHLLASDGSIRALGTVDGSVEDLRWSRDGARIMALAADIGSDNAGANSATTIGDVADDPQVVRPAELWRRLWTVDVATGEAAPVPLPGLNVWEFDWHGGEVAALVSEDPSEGGWYDARVVRIADGGVTTVFTPQLQVASVRLAPGSGAIALVEALASDRGVLYAEAVTVIGTGGELAQIPPGFDVAEVSWIDDRRLLCAGMSHLEDVVAVLDVDGGVTTVFAGDAELGSHHFPLAVVSPDGAALVASHSSWEHPPELRSLSVATPGEGWRDLSGLNRTAASIELPHREPVRWTASDGLELEGFVVTPRAPSDRPIPLIVNVHGGPTAAYGNAYPRYSWLWPSEAGYALFLPNPRGSVGRGSQFTEANLGDMGGEDLGDILSGVDALVERGLVDGSRVGIMGGSYGGFMSAWAITQTDRFKAAVAIAAVTDWLSFHNTTNIARFDELFLQADPYDPNGAYLSRSPVAHVRRVKTPTLVMHGELDLCVPLSQGREFYTALAAEGVPTELVIYPREGHGWTEREHLLDGARRIRAWFERHLSE